MVPCKNQIAQFQKSLGSKHPRSCFHLPIGFGRFASRAAQSTVGSPLPSWRFDQSNGKWNADIICLNICSYQTVLLIYRLKVSIASRVDMGKVTQNQAPIRLHLGNLFHLFQCDSGPRTQCARVQKVVLWLDWCNHCRNTSGHLHLQGNHVCVNGSLMLNLVPYYHFVFWVSPASHMMPKAVERSNLWYSWKHPPNCEYLTLVRSPSSICFGVKQFTFVRGLMTNLNCIGTSAPPTSWEVKPYNTFWEDAGNLVFRKEPHPSPSSSETCHGPSWRTQWCHVFEQPSASLQTVWHEPLLSWTCTRCWNLTIYHPCNAKFKDLICFQVSCNDFRKRANVKPEQFCGPHGDVSSGGIDQPKASIILVASHSTFAARKQCFAMQPGALGTGKCLIHGIDFWK